MKYWNRCDVCGRFIAYADFGDSATRRPVTPDSHQSAETWETLCIDHSPLKNFGGPLE